MFVLRRHIPALWLVAAAVIMMRALVPSGWMPLADSGGVRIVLCTAQGPVYATLERDGRIHHGDEQQNLRDACPFATAAQPFQPAPPVALLDPLPAAAPLNAPALVAALIAARKAVRPPARGPPAFA